MVDCEHMAWSESATEEADDEGQQAPPAHSTKQEAQDDQRVAEHRAKGRGCGCRGGGNHLLHHLVVCRACHIEHRVGDNLHLGGCRYKVARKVDIKHREEGEDIGDNDHEVGKRKAKHRDKVLPQIASACAVLANLRHRILKEDEDTDDDNEDTTTNLYCGVVLIYRALQEGIYRK